MWTDLCLGSGLESDLLDQVARKLKSVFDRYSQSFDYVRGESITMRVCDLKVIVNYSRSFLGNSNLVYRTTDGRLVFGKGTILPDGAGIDIDKGCVNIAGFIEFF